MISSPLNTFIAIDKMVMIFVPAVLLITRSLTLPVLFYTQDAVNYFITFRTYGTWLHGDARGSVDRKQNQFGEPLREPSPALERFMRASMRHDYVILNEDQRACAEQAIRGLATFRGWSIHALNVRTNHVHIVVTTPDEVKPEKVMNDFKARATRRLREEKLMPADVRIWESHGSTRYLRTEEAFYAACHYVLHCQDDPTEPEA